MNKLVQRPSAPLNAHDLSLIGDEPRLLDVRVAERLGYERPADIRPLIERSSTELAGYGDIIRMMRKNGGRGRPAREVWLNEAQALLVCMFSRTPNAAAIRREIIEVYIAIRHGRLAPAPADSWQTAMRQQAAVQQAVAFHIETKEPNFAEALAHLVTEDGRGRRFPAFWSDFDVRRAVVNLHRQVTLDEAIAALRERFGPQRTPSRTTVGRFWQTLDKVRVGMRGRK